jgi:hypothetical protein
MNKSVSTMANLKSRFRQGVAGILEPSGAGGPLGRRSASHHEMNGQNRTVNPPASAQ